MEVKSEEKIRHLVSYSFLGLDEYGLQSTICKLKLLSETQKCTVAFDTLEAAI